MYQDTGYMHDFESCCACMTVKYNIGDKILQVDMYEAELHG